MDPMQAQKLTDLRQKILENERAGKPAHEGISPDELAEALSALRANRVVASSRGGETTAKARKAKAGKAPVDTSSAKMRSILDGLD